MAAAEVSTNTPAVDVPSREYVEVYDEPMHPTVFENDFVRVLKVDCPRNRDTMLHRHSQDSFFLFFRTTEIRNEVVGKEPFEVELEGGSFYWGDHLANPIVHKICVGKQDLDCMDIEFKEDRPKPTRSLGPALPNTSKRHLCFENDVMRAYRTTLAPGEDIRHALALGDDRVHGVGEGKVSVGWSCLAVAMKSAKLSRGEVKAGDRWWCSGDITISRDSSSAATGDSCDVGGTSWGNVGDQEAEIMIVQPK